MKGALFFAASALPLCHLCAHLRPLRYLPATFQQLCAQNILFLHKLHRHNQLRTQNTLFLHKLPPRQSSRTERLPPPLSGRSVEGHQSVPAIRLPRLCCPESLKTRGCVDNSTKLLNPPHIQPSQVLVAKGSVADELQELAPRQLGQKMTGKKRMTRLVILFCFILCQLFQPDILYCLLDIFRIVFLVEDYIKVIQIFFSNLENQSQES